MSGVGVRRAVRALQDSVDRSGASMTISSGGHEVTIAPRGDRTAPTASQGDVALDHNEGATDDGAQLDLQDPAGKTSRNRPGGMNVGRLRSFLERIEKLDEERKAIVGDIRDVYTEAKGVGYDVKTIRKIIALRRLTPADRAEQEELLDTYKHALGMD